MNRKYFTVLAICIGLHRKYEKILRTKNIHNTQISAVSKEKSPDKDDGNKVERRVFSTM